MANRIIIAALAAALALAGLALTAKATLAAAPEHKPSNSCADWDLEEARITDEIAIEQPLWWLVQGNNLAIFSWNMKWAFNVDVDADTLYVIQARTATPSNLKSVHIFTVRNNCITQYKLTWASLIAEMLRYDAWEKGNPHVDGQPDREVPPGRPLPSMTPSTVPLT